MDDEFGDWRPLNYKENLSGKEKMKRNNPRNESVGDYTGRCMNCGSKDLWTDNLTYGCNDCKNIYIRN